MSKSPQDSSAEKARLVREYLEAVRQSQVKLRPAAGQEVETLLERLGTTAAVPITTPEQVEAILARIRREMPKAAGASDVDLLRLMIVHLTGSHEKALPPDRREIQELITKGKELCYAHQFDEARRVLRRCEALALKAGDEYGDGWAKQYLGRVERDTGNLEGALDLYERALEGAHRASDAQLVSVLYDQMGTTFRIAGHLDRAQVYFQMALVVEPRSASFVKANLAIVHKLRGDTDRAESLDGESRLGYEHDGNRRGVALSTLQRALACRDRRDYPGAAKLAIEARRKAVDSKYAQVIDDVGKLFASICAKLLQAPDALAQFKKILELEWRAEEWHLRRLILTNCFMDCVERKLFTPAAETGWELVKLAVEHNDASVVTGIRRRHPSENGPLETVQVSLESAYTGKAPCATPTEAAVTALALAYCKAALGETGAAIRLAAEARAHFLNAHLPEGVQRAEQLSEEVLVAVGQVEEGGEGSTQASAFGDSSQNRSADGFAELHLGTVDGDRRSDRPRWLEGIFRCWRWLLSLWRGRNDDHSRTVCQQTKREVGANTPSAEAVSSRTAEVVFPPGDAESRLMAAVWAAGEGGDATGPDRRYLDALARYPDATHIRLEYATLLDWLGRNTDAVPVLREGLRRSPNDPSLAAQLAWALVESGGDLTELDQLIQIARKLKRTWLPLADTAAWSLYRQGNYEEALRVQEPALQLAFQVPEVAYHAGAILAKLGRRDEASDYLTLALQYDRPFSGREEAERLARELSL